jgi:NhaP-type Na+/H+ or K+/H+ antiporter
MHHGPELAVAIVLCVTIVIGALLRASSRRWGFPYTVLLLLAGLATGVGLQWMPHEGVAGTVADALRGGTAISPDLIIFIFLPALIFESAFSIPVHAFRKVVGATAVLAVPVLLVSTVATAALMMGLTSVTPGWAWGWGAALAFGALASATDPVAVVALLRELGAPKRLALLIEGESLLNDGTAIVAFMALLGLVTGAGELSAAHTVLDFLRVTGGGLAVGLVLSMVTARWLGATYNAPLIEISLTLALAYGCMAVAEGLFHVSGVMALVAAGLWMSGPGRVQISPDVGHTLHRFWEMLAHLANTLIFFLVGLVIGHAALSGGLAGLWIALAAWAGIMIVRAALLFGVRPLLSRVSEPITTGETAVMAWGGLRGAVSLALALIVQRHPDVPPELGRQMLVATAGVVLLTLLVNGTTTGALLRWLRFDQPSPGERLARLTAAQGVLRTVGGRIAQASRSRGLQAVDWGEVNHDLEQREASVAQALEAVRAELAAAPPAERALGWWRQALAIEREALWSAYAEGTLGASALQTLDHEVDLELDRIATGTVDPGTARRRGGSGARVGVSGAVRLETPDRPLTWRERMTRWWQRGGPAFSRLRFSAVALRYDLCRGEALAAEKVLAALDSMDGMDPDIGQDIRANYQRTLHGAVGQLEDLRANLPEITRALETRLARRVQLNFERDQYRALAHTGALDHGTAETALSDIDQRVVKLGDTARRLTLPTIGQLCADAPLFAALDTAGRERVGRIARECTLSPGESLFRQGDAGDSLFVVARGALAVVREADGETQLLDIVGGGQLLGEMALLTDAPRMASARAVTTATLGELPRAEVEALLAEQPGARAAILEAFASHRFDNALRADPQWRHLDHDARHAWFESGRVVEYPAGAPLPPIGAEAEDDAGTLFLVSGVLTASGTTHSAPTLLTAEQLPNAAAAEPCLCVRLPATR